VLSLYPDTYFTQLKGSYYRNIVLCLTGALHPLDAASNISNAGAFATESNGTMQLAFDLYDDLSPDTVVHELTHAADYRFAGEGLLSEDEWNSMNPKGFSYYYSYINESGESYETAGSPENTAVSGCPVVRWKWGSMSCHDWRQHLADALATGVCVRSSFSVSSI